MAGTRARRVRRALLAVLVLALAAAALGVGTTTVLRARDAGSSHGMADPNRTLLAAASSFSSDIDAQTFHLVPPGGRGPIVVERPSATPAAPPPTTAPGRPTAAAPRAPAARPAPVPPGRTALPLGVDPGASTQVITVVAPSPGSTSATLTAWQLGPGGWTAVVGPVPARIGRDGIGAASEQLWRTPAGTYTLTQAFGRLADPGTGLPYRTINSRDYWVSDAGPRYNQFYECTSGPCPSAENLSEAGASYNYAVVIDYNRWPAVPGAGSAFFLHVTNGAPTAGCVAISQSSLVAIMRWLNPAAHPLISMGVG